MVSLWEKESFLTYNVIIIGAGISGLSTAASLKERKPELNILVLERGALPTGASTRNAGFACFGSISELVCDQQLLGDDGMTNLVYKRWQGLNKTLSRLGKDKVGYEPKGGYELLSAQNIYLENRIDQLNDLLRPIFNKIVFVSANEKIPEFGFANTEGLVFNRFEGQLHTGKLMRSLWEYCGRLGIHIVCGTPVTDFVNEGNQIKVMTNEHIFQAGSVAICTNAFTPCLIKQEIDLKPGRGTVLVIQPEKPLQFQGTFHYDEGYYYFRDYQGKIIFGGGRNMAFDEEETTDFGTNHTIINKLHEDLRARIIPGQAYRTELSWSGIMAFGKNKQPILAELSERIYLGVRLGGMGVAMGSMIGEELADMIISKHF